MNITLICDKSDQSPLGLTVKKGVTERLKGGPHSVIVHELAKEDLHHCIGCFHCWIKDPGQCVFDDAGRALNRDYIGSDLVVLVSPVRFGCYSTVIRRFWDRSLPTILPFFKKINGEVHHAPRYERYPGLWVVGYGEALSPSEKETFKALNDANAVNFQIDQAVTYFVDVHVALGPVIDAMAARITA